MFTFERLKFQISKTITSDSRWRIVTADQSLVRAIPIELEEALPPIGNSVGISDSAWLTLHFWIDNRPKPRLGVFWRTTSVRDRESRNRVLKAFLESAGTGFRYRGAKNAWSAKDDPAFSGKTVSNEWWPSGEKPDLNAARDEIRKQLNIWTERVSTILHAMKSVPEDTAVPHEIKRSTDSEIHKIARSVAVGDSKPPSDLNVTLRRGDASSFLVALREDAQRYGMSHVAESARLNRENLYRMLSANGNPTLSNLLTVLTALGLRLEVNRRGAKLREVADNDEGLSESIPHNSFASTKQERSNSSNRRQVTAALQPMLAKRLRHCARQQGISFETLVNLWLSEKLIEADR